MTGQPPSTYFHDFDADKALREFALGERFQAEMKTLSRDELRARQERQFAVLLRRAWQIPFYQRLWGEQGIEPGDIAGLDDLHRLPVFGKAEISASIEAHPPYGDFHGRQPGVRTILHTTTGTTGRPQTLLYGVRSREIQNLLLARAYMFQGLRPDDTVHSIYGFGMVNGGHYIREAILHFTEAVLLPAGTGNDTRSTRQIELMRDFGVTVMLGFADYMRKLAQTAVQMGIEPGRDIPMRMISGHMGRESKQAISAMWGNAQVFDWYGIGDTGIIAAEGPDHDGLYLFEDAHWVEVLDTDTGSEVAGAEPGNLVVTTLFKDDIYPIIRFNSQDMTRVLPGESSLGMNLRRIDGFLGRSDNMVKLRGINVFPHAFAAFLAGHNALNGEYLCRVSRTGGGRDQMSLHVESRVPDQSVSNNELRHALQAEIKAALGVEIEVVIEPAGALATQTQVATRQKAIRLLDERFTKKPGVHG